MRVVNDETYGFDMVFDGYNEFATEPEPTAREAAQQLVRTSLRPCSMSEVTKELARVRIGTAGRAATGEDMEAWLIVFGEELREFPLDVVKECCRKWVRREKWNPTVAEIRDSCQRAVTRRQAMLRTLRGGQ